MASSTSAFLQSLMIIGREGFEVVLLLGAMLGVLRKSGAAHRTHGLWWGAGLALVASLVTALVVESLFRSSARAELEVMEGFTMLLAAVILCAVGHWLLARAEAARWQAYLKGRLRAAAEKGSVLALGSVAFLAVFREGGETVLFYRALLSDAGVPGAAVAAGFVAGLTLLALLCYAIFRFGVRVPLRPFFTVTGALLLLLAFTFVGKGLHELQEGGIFAETGVSFLPFPPLGLYPTVETLAGQAVVLLAILAPLGYKWALSRERVPPALESSGIKPGRIP